MKKVLLAMLFVAFSAPVFTACDDDDNDNKKPKAVTVTSGAITGEGIEDVTKVKAVYTTQKIQLPDAASTSASAGGIVPEVDLADGKFTLTLPATIDEAKYNTLKQADLPATLKLSKDMKYVVAGFEANDDAAKVGDIYERFRNGEGTVVVIVMKVYVDKDATLKGDFETKDGDVVKAKDIWDASFKRGWNTLYYKWENVAAEGETPAYVKNTYSSRPFAETLAWQYIALPALD